MLSQRIKVNVFLSSKQYWYKWCTINVSNLYANNLQGNYIVKK